MRADPRFANRTVSFWAYVRAISEALGYTKRHSDRISSFSTDEMISALDRLERSSDLLGPSGKPSRLGLDLQAYFDYRATVLNDKVRGDLMTAEQARAEFEAIRRSVDARDRADIFGRRGNVIAVEYSVGQSRVRIPMNKQSGSKRAVAYLTGMVNLLVAHTLDGRQCDYDPRKITVIDHEGALYAALSRRMDGSFPSTTNPTAVWEVKEYYYTTSFGSKVSDAVYITSLDGYERLEVEHATDTKIEHLVMVDAYDTWWGKGKSYLCKLIDILNMGHVDEILFGREVRTRLPEIVANWSDEPLEEPSKRAFHPPLGE